MKDTESRRDAGTGKKQEDGMPSVFSLYSHEAKNIYNFLQGVYLGTLDGLKSRPSVALHFQTSLLHPLGGTEMARTGRHAEVTELHALVR